MNSFHSNSTHFNPPAMKILKIFGVVVAVHVIAFVVIFANPGCRSTSSSKNETASAAVPVSNAGGDDYVPVMPVSMDGPAAASDSTSFVSLNSQPDGRSTPTRPGGVSDATAEIIPAAAYSVQRGDSLWSIARKHGITTAELSAANNLQGNATLQIGRQLLVPGKSGMHSTDSATAASSSAGTKTYTVKSGDNLTTIASRNGTSISALRSANNLRSDIVRVGQELKIPGTEAAPSSPAKKAQVSAPAAASSAGPAVHTVKIGDTLGAISRRYKVSVTEIAKANNITDPTKIRVGQDLVIPGAASGGAVTASSPAPSVAAPAPDQPAVPVQIVPIRASDLDAALPPDFIDAPVIQVVDPGAPRIE